MWCWVDVGGEQEESFKDSWLPAQKGIQLSFSTFLYEPQLRRPEPLEATRCPDRHSHIGALLAIYSSLSWRANCTCGLLTRRGVLTHCLPASKEYESIHISRITFSFPFFLQISCDLRKPSFIWRTGNHKPVLPWVCVHACVCVHSTCRQ